MPAAGTIPDTFPKLLKRNYARFGPDRIAIRHKKFGIWQRYSWSDYYQKAKYFGLGMKRLGLQRGDKVCIIGDNEPESYFSELGVQGVGGIIVGIYTDALPEEVEYLVGHSEARFAVVEDQEQVDKFLQVAHKLPMLKKIIYWDPKGLSTYDSPLLVSFEEVCQLGKEYEKERPDFFETSIEQGSGDDVAMILYTSGTRALPKGAILTYRNVLSALEMVMKLDDWKEDGRIFSLVPLAWIPEQVFGIGGALLTGCCVFFAEEPETVQRDMREIAPTQLSLSARQWESLVSSMLAKIEDAPWFNRLLFKLLLPVGIRHAEVVTSRRNPGFILRLLYRLADLILYRHIRDDMGLSELRFGWSSAAAISPDSVKVLQAIGIPLRLHYASTEACVICNSGKELRAETVGRPVPGTEVRITKEGEILVRGPQVFKGYYRDPEATKKALRNGWFHTGDAGFIDDEGHLIFLDRLADLVELSNGSKVAPQYIESRLRFSPYIKDAVVIAGRDSPFVSVIVTIDFDSVGTWAEKKKIPYSTYTDLSQKKEVYDLVHKEVLKVNKMLPLESKIKRFVVLHKELDPDEAELTRSRKIRRDFIKEKYHDIISGIYGGLREIPVSARVRYRDGRESVIKTNIRVEIVEDAQ